MNVAILGPQGSGKGTQAELLSDKYDLIRIETGKILRELVVSGKPGADDIKNIMNNGKLVPDEILQEIIKSRLENLGNRGIIFDGTPRDIAQYGLIKKILGENNLALDRVVYLKIPREETLKRLMGRRTCVRCNRIYNLLTKPPRFADKCDCGGSLMAREDDTEESINKRLAEYEEATIPVLNLARDEGLLIEIDGTGEIAQVFVDIEKGLGLV